MDSINSAARKRRKEAEQKIADDKLKAAIELADKKNKEHEEDLRSRGITPRPKNA